MNLKWDYQLKAGELSNPVLFIKEDIEGVSFEFDEEKVLSVLTAKGHQLKTWGGGAATSEPHWIGVKKSTPLHTDPRYPRYTHHLLVKVDDFGLRGLDKESTILKDFQYLVIDTHSPHQLHSLKRGATYYIAASIDSDTILDEVTTIGRLVEFVNTSDIAKKQIG